MVQIDIHYQGDLHCQALHAPSGSELATDAPRDNQGKGEDFSPTDLLATALGTCALTTMGMVARRHGWTIDGIDLRVQKHMTTQPPRKVERLVAEFRVPPAIARGLSADARGELARTAATCPVALSLHPGVAIEISFDW